MSQVNTDFKSLDSPTIISSKSVLPLSERCRQGLAQNLTMSQRADTLASAHDFESHEVITEENIFLSIFAGIIFLSTACNFFHLACQGNVEQWVTDLVQICSIEYVFWNDLFDNPAVVDVVTLFYNLANQCWDTISMWAHKNLYVGLVFFAVLLLSALFIRVLFQPVRGFCFLNTNNFVFKKVKQNKNVIKKGT